MTIQQQLEEIEFLRKKIKDISISTIDLLKTISNIHLDWGYEDSKFDKGYDIGSTKSIMLSGLSENRQNLKIEILYTDSNPIAKELFNTFLNKGNLTTEIILKIHSHLFDDGGQWRSDEVAIKGPNSELISNFPKSNEINDLMGKLIDWYNSEKSTNHPAIIATLFHFNFVKIHPFLDGNGRIARILTSMILLEEKIPPPIMNTDDRGDYFSSLRNADSGEIEPLTKFILDRIILSLKLIVSSKLNPNV